MYPLQPFIYTGKHFGTLLRAAQMAHSAGVQHHGRASPGGPRHSRHVPRQRDNHPPASIPGLLSNIIRLSAESRARHGPRGPGILAERRWYWYARRARSLSQT